MQITDVLGPRGRQRVAVGSVISVLIFAALMVAAVRRLQAKGQFEPELWRGFAARTIGSNGRLYPIARFLLSGLWSTLRVTIVALAITIVVGVAMALVRLSRRRATRSLGTVYVQLFRGLPLLLLIYFAEKVLPGWGKALGWDWLASLDRGWLLGRAPTRGGWFVVLGLSLYYSAVVSEIIRTGVNSLPSGQHEAAAAIGLTHWQGLRLVLLPQAIRRMTPDLLSQSITLFKDSSFGLAVAYEDLLRRGQINGEFLSNPLQSLFVVAVVYIIVSAMLSTAVARIQRKGSR